MADKVDLVVRHGLVVDGRGGEPYEADIAVRNGRIVAVGDVLATGTEEIDAKGRIVTPGFVDVHTHYDGQATWDERLHPSSFHGVTTAVMGNCGVGFAPCRPDQRDMLLRLMEGVEDIPGVVLSEGVPWQWESFPDYFDFLSRRRYDIDVAGYVPHAALRVYVRGERAASRDAATPRDLAEMDRLMRQAMQAGAMGFGTSRTLLHRSSNGETTPTLKATEEELTVLARAVRETGDGLMQFVSDWDPQEDALSELDRIIAGSGCRISFAMTQNHRRPDIWRRTLDWVAQANDAGKWVKVQILPRPLGLLLGHELTLNPFYTTETYRALSCLPFAEKIRALRQPDIRARIINEPPDPNPTNALGVRTRFFDRLFELSDPPNYEPSPDDSVAAQAARMGVRPEERAYDLLLERDGRNLLYMAISNYAEASLDTVHDMLSHRDTVPGLGDAGAHLGSICDGSYSTFLLTHWARDRKHDRFTLPLVVKSLSHDTASVMGLNDRGVLAPGYRADINVIDFDHLRLGVPTIQRDLPAGGRRLMQRASGYDVTVVGGAVTYRNGEATGALPGRLVRGHQAAP